MAVLLENYLRCLRVLKILIYSKILTEQVNNLKNKNLEEESAKLYLQN